MTAGHPHLRGVNTIPGVKANPAIGPPPHMRGFNESRHTMYHQYHPVHPHLRGV